MTGEQLIKELQALPPEQLKLDVILTHTEYASPEDSMGYENVKEIDSVRLAYGKKNLQLEWS